MTSDERCNKASRRFLERGRHDRARIPVRLREGKREREREKGTKKETVTRITEYGIPIRRNDRLRYIPLRHLMKSSDAFLDSSRKSRPSRESE